MPFIILFGFKSLNIREYMGFFSYSYCSFFKFFFLFEKSRILEGFLGKDRR